MYEGGDYVQSKEDIRLFNCPQVNVLTWISLIAEKCEWNELYFLLL